MCLGSLGADVFSTSLQEALPLADKPHLLQPNARREELFGIPRAHTHNAGGILFIKVFYNCELKRCENVYLNPYHWVIPLLSVINFTHLLDISWKQVSNSDKGNCSGPRM